MFQVIANKIIQITEHNNTCNCILKLVFVFRF